MTDLITIPRATVQQALEALELDAYGEPPRHERNSAIAAIRKALEQSEQEQAEPSASWPTAIDIADELDALLPISMGYSTRASIETWWRDLVQRRLEQPEQDTDCHAQGVCQRSGYGIGQQEPVAVKQHDPDIHMVGPNDGGRVWIEELSPIPVGTKLYTEPPRREWQFLSAEERYRIADESASTIVAVLATEAALRSKNHE
jgi:hypothetical protein